MKNGKKITEKGHFGRAHLLDFAGKKYKLGPVLGDGGYGTVFQSQDDDIKIAVKTEKFSKSQLRIEIIVLKAAMHANCKHFCELIDCVSDKK